VRRIAYISGTRADYGPMRSTLARINEEPVFELGVIVTGMHLQAVHGDTIEEICRDGLAVVGRVPAHTEGDSPVAMAISIGKMLEGMAVELAEFEPDVVLTLGDRGEQVAAALAAALQNRVVVHLCGGSLSGSIDDSFRHAITKLAHYHLPACEEHARRIVQMGEPPDRVIIAGLPGADISKDARYSRDHVCSAYGLPVGQPYVLVIQHPVTQCWEETEQQITATLEAVVATGLPTLLANPNDDAGGRVILDHMRSWSLHHPQLKLLPPPASREMFASIMAHAGVLVGNSSCGVIEAASVDLPVVNIGERQRGREGYACAVNVGYQAKEILAGMRRALFDESYRMQVARFESDLVGPTERLVVQALRDLDLAVARKPKPFHLYEG